MGRALGRARLCHVVDNTKRSTADIFTDAVSGLEDASIQISTLVPVTESTAIGKRDLLDSGTHAGSCGGCVRMRVV